jgi:uncharacterized protein with FMN-binding domain
VKRWPLVFGGTVAGLVGVLTFHTTQPRSGFATLGASSSSSSSSSSHGGASAASPAASPLGSAARTRPAGKAASASPTAAASRPAAATSTRTAVGQQVNYNWGILSVRVTVSGKRIVDVRIASLDDGGNPRSQMIDQQSIPMLEQQVMAAQSANIQGVSGASYTSAGFVQSLQSALQSLGV